MKKLSYISLGFILLSSAVSATENIARSIFTSGVENREPIDKVGQLTNDNEKIYFFTEIKGMSGRTITHRWEHAGNVKAEVAFKVGSNRWRIWSSKTLQPQWLGEWIVTVVDDAGNTLAEESMAYIPNSSDEGVVMPSASPTSAVTDSPAVN
ncbi:MAG: DUF2914 domain-containing protein [Gammaproteobacteria bacterium]|nr:DUF2914 domain-containing protein [Gammaproteobacteria bacterium]